MIAVQKYQVLYDKSLKDFKNLQVKVNAWEAMANAVETNSQYDIFK